MSAGPTHDDAAQVLEARLISADLADRVEMVVRPLGPGPSGAHRYRAAAVDGSVEFERTEHGGRYRYRVVAPQGRDPLTAPAPAALLHPQPYLELRARVDRVIEGERRGTVSP